MIKKGEVMRCGMNGCNGPVKPNLIFFGESLPQDFYSKLEMAGDCDLMIVIGTALAVAPFNMLVNMAPKGIP
jgi:NAD-dependent histone deacetylase SIR2